MHLLNAAHISKYVQFPGFSQRGGIFLVSPPANFKSTIIEGALEDWPDALTLSDLNVQTLIQLKQEISKGSFSTIGFGEFEKIYERNPATSSNLEGTLRAMVEEGFGNPSFQSPLTGGSKAKILMICGITPDAHGRRFLKWGDSGFLRRFLWVKFKLKDQKIIGDAIHKGKRLEFGKIEHSIPANRVIPYKMTQNVSNKLRHMVREQPSEETPFVLLKKIYCALEWSMGTKKALWILEDCATCFQREDGFLEI